jgi:predicted Na+-dependent transporter
LNQITVPPKLPSILGVFTRIHAASQIANFAIFSQIAEMSVHFFDLSKESGFGNLNLRRLPTTSDSRNVLVLAKQAHFIFTITIIMLTLPLSKLDGISVYRTD